MALGRVANVGQLLATHREGITQPVLVLQTVALPTLELRLLIKLAQAQLIPVITTLKSSTLQAQELGTLFTQPLPSYQLLQQ